MRPCICPLSDFTRRYRSAEEHLDCYRKLFELRENRFDREVQTSKFFGKKINPFFAIACIYNHKNELLVFYDIKDEAWSLLGNYLLCGESLLECLNRVVSSRTGMNIDVARPFCYAENTFHCNGGTERIIQKGIAFLVQARPAPAARRFGELQKQWVTPSNMPSKWYMGSADILRLAFEELSQHPDWYHAKKPEIDSSRSAGWKYKLHTRYVSPILRPFSSALLAKKLAAIMMEFPDFGSVLDAACGTDHTVLEIANKYLGATVIANDLCWEYLRQLANHDSSRRIIFLNQDLSDFGFRPETCFDVILFKNTLHHLPSAVIAESVLRRLCKLSHRFVVTDIESPHNSNYRARFAHAYYKHWLNDCGGLFYSWDAFRDLMTRISGARAVTFDRISTIKGRYMFAVVDPPPLCEAP